MTKSYMERSMTNKMEIARKNLQQVQLCYSNVLATSSASANFNTSTFLNVINTSNGCNGISSNRINLDSNSTPCVNFTNCINVTVQFNSK